MKPNLRAARVLLAGDTPVPLHTRQSIVASGVRGDPPTVSHCSGWDEQVFAQCEEG
jgi:hypothetical protein